MSSGICGRQRPRSACTSVQSDQGPHCLRSESLETRKWFSGEQMPGWDSAHVWNDIFSENTITSYFYTPPHNSGGVLWFHVGHPCVRLSVHPSYIHPSVRFSFPDDNMSKHQWIFTKLGMCIDIMEIWFGIANGQMSSIFDRVICPRHTHIFVSRL